MKHKSALTAGSLMLVLVGCHSEEMANIEEQKYKNITVIEIVTNSGDLDYIINYSTEEEIKSILNMNVDVLKNKDIGLINKGKKETVHSQIPEMNMTTRSRPQDQDHQK